MQGTFGLVATVTSRSFAGVSTPVRAVQFAVGDYREVADFQSTGSIPTGVASGDVLAATLFVAWSHALVRPLCCDRQQ